MTLAFYTHAEMLAHTPPSGHDETPARLASVLGAVDDSDLVLERLDAPLADVADLRLVHSERYLATLAAAEPQRGYRPLAPDTQFYPWQTLAVFEPDRRLDKQSDPDTWLSSGSMRGASRAVGAVTAAVRRVAAGESQRAFCAVRPPGHHAGVESPMGFCLYSSVAIGARVAQAAGLRRVAVVDFDVHHGNGTQAVFETDPDLFFASVHEAPRWPFTGDPSETGVGNIANATVPPGAPRAAWRQAFEGLMARVDAFGPDLILVSAGFDAHARDPLADQQLEAEDFAWATGAIVSAANGRARGRVVSSLEGGYDLQALGRSALAHVRALQGA